MKKLIPNLLIIFLLVLGVYFYINTENEIIISEKNLENTGKIKNKIPEVQLVEKNQSNSKIAKVLNSINQKSRKPTFQNFTLSENLVGHQILNNSRWKIWQAARAIPIEQTKASDQVIGKLSRFNIIDVGSEEVSLKQFNKSALLVVYDNRLKRTGLITGLIKVETEQKSLLEKLIQQQNAYISNSFDNINTYFVASEQNIFDLEKLYMDLKIQSYIKSIELDILDREYGKK